MRHFFFASITRTAVLVVLVSVLPAMSLIFATGLQRLGNEEVRAQALGERYVRVVSAYQSQTAQVMETFTRLLAQAPELKQRDVGAISLLFKTLTQSIPDYVNIFLLDASGSVVASGLPIQEGLDFSRYPFFRRVLARNDFSVGQIVLSKTSDEPVLYFALPVPREDGNKADILCVALRFSRYDAAFDGLEIAPEASVLLVDGSGLLAAGYPLPTPVAPGQMLGGEIWRLVQNEQSPEGRLLVQEADGKRFYAAYRKLYLPNMDQPYFYVFSLNAEGADSSAKARLRRDILLSYGAVLLAMLVAWMLCYKAFLQPWGLLVAAAAAVAGGELDAQVPAENMEGEIGLLAREFNAMIVSIAQHDQELVAAREVAEISRAAKSEFLANMSHEMRTSMNAILGMAHLVLKTELSPQQTGYVTKLLNAANTLLRIINDILDLSKLEAGKLSMEHIGFSLRRIVATIRSEATLQQGERDLGFQFHVDPQVNDSLVGDPFRLSQALTALVNDAVARSERGDVVFACSVLDRDEANISLQFTIRDAGVGLTPMQLAELRDLLDHEEEAQPSFLDKDRLSLAVSNKLFRMMGGRVSVESEFGRGVLFTAWGRFRYVADDSCRQYDVFSQERALILDASERSRQDIQETLVRFGFDVVCTSDLDSAIQVLEDAERERSPFAVTFVDWRISSEKGGRIDRLFSRGSLVSPPAFIITTPASRVEMPTSLQHIDFDALLPKPIEETLLFDTLVEILARRRELASSGIAGMRILVAEDNSVNQQIAQEILENEGVRVTIAENGKEAIRLLEEGGPGAYDLVLMDVQMPQCNGIEATQAIRAKKEFHFLRLPIIAMTAHSEGSELASCMAAGMNDHAGKPIIVDKFFATLRRWRPVNGENALKVQAAAAHVREAASGAAPSSPVAEALQAMAPYLHEGRIEAVRNLLAKGSADTFRSIAEALECAAADALAREEQRASSSAPSHGKAGAP